VKDLPDVNDIDHVDLLLSIAARAITSMDESKLKAIQPLLEKAEKLAGQIQGIIEVELKKQETTAGGLGGETKASVGFFDLLKSNVFARFRFEEEVRKTVRPERGTDRRDATGSPAHAREKRGTLTGC
jgi:hypothetical protein